MGEYFLAADVSEVNPSVCGLKMSIRGEESYVKNTNKYQKTHKKKKEKVKLREEK